MSGERATAVHDSHQMLGSQIKAAAEEERHQHCLQADLAKQMQHIQEQAKLAKKACVNLQEKRKALQKEKDKLEISQRTLNSEIAANERQIQNLWNSMTELEKVTVRVHQEIKY